MARGIELGDEVRDCVTGLTGIAIGRTRWLTGCDTIAVKPNFIKDGKSVDAEYFDVMRLEIVTAGKVILPGAVPTKPLAGVGVG